MTPSSGRQWTVFFAYTAWSVVLVLVMVPLGVLALLGLSLPAAFAAHPIATTVLLLQILIGAWSGRRTMTAWSRAELPTGRDRWDLPRVGRLPVDAMLWATAGLSAVIAVLYLAGDAGPQLLTVSLIALQVRIVIRWRWEIGVGSALVLGVLAVLLGADRPIAATMFALMLAAVLTVRMSLWLAAMVRELDSAREAQAQLAVAEERLRFARDLHDVTGRDLSVIAVKSELVAQLAEREDPRAVEHGREVAQIARTSLAEIRSLVRGYREADLATELRGTASLLRSARAEVTIRGDAGDVPARHAGTAAWVLREGGTNILRHADPSAVTLTLSPDGVTLVNDGAPGDDEVLEGSGLTGMRERLGAGSALEVHREGGVFTLAVRFDPPEGNR